MRIHVYYEIAAFVRRRYVVQCVIYRIDVYFTGGIRPVLYIENARSGNSFGTYMTRIVVAVYEIYSRIRYVYGREIGCVDRRVPQSRSGSLKKDVASRSMSLRSSIPRRRSDASGV